MPQLIPASFKALRSLFAPGMFGTMIICVLVTLAALAGFIMGSTAIGEMWFQWIREDSTGSGMFGIVTAITSAIIAWFLFPGIMPVIVNFFGERICGLIERHDYPAAHTLQTPSFWKEFWHDARFSLTAILLNLLVLPLYFVPVINLFLFYLLNGYLLGREFFVMVARRHMPSQQAEILRKSKARVVLFAGMAITLAATIPIVNLFAPFWGIALMTHLYHGFAGTKKSEILLP